MPDTREKSLGKRLDKIAKRLDMIIVILLARSGLKLSEIADILEISERTIQNWLPFRQIKQSGKEE